METFQVSLQNLWSVVYGIDVLADNPDARGLGLWLVEAFEVVEQFSQDFHVLFWVFPENVSDDYDGFL